MHPKMPNARRACFLALPLIAASFALPPSPASAQQQFVIKAVAEKKLTQLPAGPLFWRLERFPSLAAARSAESPASLAGEVAGQAWLATLGPKGGTTTGGSQAAEIGPLPPVAAAEYLLRMNNSGGAPGAATSAHLHAGSESFFVLAGRLSQKTPEGIAHVDAGGMMAGRAPGASMVVSSSGTVDLDAIVLFLVDAAKPFTTPSKLD